MARNADKIGIWLRRTDLNRRPSGYEPDELPLLYSAIRVVWDFLKVDGVRGFEPLNDWTKTSCLTAWRYPNVFKSCNYIDFNAICQGFLIKKLFLLKIKFPNQNLKEKMAWKWFSYFCSLYFKIWA